ncbi:LysR family transcriptional regulator [Sulfobacillus harzensis]|uniref:LysR family transcriptional regulator n=1 Tax=Sulfobacillus harzensis TaxID=2729629 RepID=A0A7Y0L6M0_9FIRM|nr:LysR family transcriptional regulator [Sulfobacillus harzensis]NMP24201.1 LysR family transcriptional regulator [Sulfobacillus harzensis]
MEHYRFTIRDLELLVALSQSGLVKRAAERLNLTPSALSHRVRELEERLGYPISENHGHLALTPAASRLVPRAQEILAALEQLGDEASGIPDIRRVGISSLLLRGAVLEGLTRLTATPSTIRWNIVSGHSRAVEDEVEAGRLDVGLVRLERRRPSLRYNWMADDRLAAAAPASFVHPGSVEEWPWVLFSHRMGHGQAVDQALRDAGLVIVPRVRVDSFDLALRLIRFGSVSVFPWSVIADQVRSGNLQEVEVSGVVWPPRRTALVSRREPPVWAGALIRVLFGQGDLRADEGSGYGAGANCKW